MASKKVSVYKVWNSLGGVTWAVDKHEAHEVMAAMANIAEELQMSSNTVRFPEAIVAIDLDSPQGNVFAVIGTCMRAMRQVGATPKDISQFQAEAISGDYEHALDVCRQWVDFTAY